MKYLIPLLLICNALFFTACKSNISKENGKNNNTTNETEEADEEAPGGWLKQNFEMTKDPALGYVPYERLAVAQAYTQSLINSRTFNTNSLAWTERGPIQSCNLKQKKLLRLCARWACKKAIAWCWTCKIVRSW